MADPMLFMLCTVFSMMIGSLIASATGVGGYFHAHAVVVSGLVGMSVYMFGKAILFGIVGICTLVWSLFRPRD